MQQERERETDREIVPHDPMSMRHKLFGEAKEAVCVVVSCCERFSASQLLSPGLVPLARIRVHHVHEHPAQDLPADRLRHVFVEAGFHGFFQPLGHDVGRQGDDGDPGVFVASFPLADFSDRLVAVLVRHLDIALYEFSVGTAWGIVELG